MYSKIENNVFTFQKCVESKKNTEQETTSTNKSNKAISDEETIRQRKEPISKDSSSEWVEKEDASSSFPVFHVFSEKLKCYFIVCVVQAFPFGDYVRIFFLFK